MASKSSDVAGRIANMPKLALKGAVDEADQKRKDLEALSGSSSASEPAAAPESDKEDQNRKSIIAKAILALAPTLIGGALGGNAGASIGASEGMKGVAGLGESEKQQEQQRLAKLSLGATKEDKMAAAKLKADEFSELQRHHKALEGIDLAKAGKEKSARPLAAEQADKLSGHISSMKTLGDLEAAVNSNQANFGPIAGRVGSLNPYNVDQRSLEALTKTAAQNIGKSLEGGKLTDQDILRYERMVPSTSDSPDVALAKIAQLKRMVAQKQSSDLEAFSKAGLNVAEFSPSQVEALQVANKMAAAPGRVGGVADQVLGGQNAQASPAPQYDKMSMEQLMEEAKRRGIR